MNSSQKNYLRRTLLPLDRTIYELEELFKVREIDQNTYHWDNSLTADQRQSAIEHMERMKLTLRHIVREHDLLTVEADLLSEARTALQERSVELESAKSHGLQRLGPVDPALKDKLDPDLIKLQTMIHAVVELIGNRGTS